MVYLLPKYGKNIYMRKKTYYVKYHLETKGMAGKHIL